MSLFPLQVGPTAIHCTLTRSPAPTLLSIPAPPHNSIKPPCTATLLSPTSPACSLPLLSCTSPSPRPLLSLPLYLHSPILPSSLSGLSDPWLAALDLRPCRSCGSFIRCFSRCDVPFEIPAFCFLFWLVVTVWILGTVRVWFSGVDLL
jgi:hypothetical protein